MRLVTDNHKQQCTQLAVKLLNHLVSPSYASNRNFMVPVRVLNQTSAWWEEEMQSALMSRFLFGMKVTRDPKKLEKVSGDVDGRRLV